jgi:hypothetical protein
MKVAIDYDGTYTLDAGLWQAFVQAAMAAGHEVRCVTSRYPDQRVEVDCPVTYTSMEPKGPHVIAKGWVPDVWIDDHPERIFR